MTIASYIVQLHIKEILMFVFSYETNIDRVDGPP